MCVVFFDVTHMSFDNSMWIPFYHTFLIVFRLGDIIVFIKSHVRVQIINKCIFIIVSI